MSAPSEACNVKLVKIQRGEKLAITPEQTFAPDGVTCLREAKGKGCRATMQMKGLSPEITSVGGRRISFLRKSEFAQPLLARL